MKSAAIVCCFFFCCLRSNVNVQITKLRYVDGHDINDELFALAFEPDLRVQIYSACLVNGVRFHTVDREKNRRTQNSGIMAAGLHGDQDIDFYGLLKEIVELRYNVVSGRDMTVVLFRCDWFDTHGKKFRMKEDRFFKSINHVSLWYKDDPFILATQATKVFYLLDTKYREKWRVVQKFSHRHLWSVAKNDNENLPNEVVLSYQDDDCEGAHVQLTEGCLQNEQPISEDCVQVEATVVDQLRGQREAEGQQDESGDDEDETIQNYLSDNEDLTIPPEDEDDSDYEDIQLQFQFLQKVPCYCYLFLGLNVLCVHFSCSNMYCYNLDGLFNMSCLWMLYSTCSEHVLLVDGLFNISCCNMYRTCTACGWFGDIQHVLISFFLLLLSAINNDTLELPNQNG